MMWWLIRPLKKISPKRGKYKKFWNPGTIGMREKYLDMVHMNLFPTPNKKGAYRAKGKRRK